MTQRNDIIAGTCHNDIKTKRLLFSKRTKREHFKSKKSGHYYFLF